MGQFGEKLRRERELRGITLEEVAIATKIGTRNLRALEEEKFGQLPGGIFNKGFVRAYARYVGIDEEQAVSDYLAANQDSASSDEVNIHRGSQAVRSLPAMPHRAAAGRAPRHLFGAWWLFSPSSAPPLAAGLICRDGWQTGQKPADSSYIRTASLLYKHLFPSRCRLLIAAPPVAPANTAQSARCCPRCSVARFAAELHPAGCGAKQASRDPDATTARSTAGQRRTGGSERYFPGVDREAALLGFRFKSTVSG